MNGSSSNKEDESQLPRRFGSASALGGDCLVCSARLIMADTELCEMSSHLSPLHKFAVWQSGGTMCTSAGRFNLGKSAAIVCRANIEFANFVLFTASGWNDQSCKFFLSFGARTFDEILASWTPSIVLEMLWF